AKCDGINFASKIAENFYKAYLINEGLRKSEISSFIMLRNASWACDDSNDKKNAIICRLKALKILDELILHEEKNKEILILIKIDFLRRCKKFSEVINNYNNYQFFSDEDKEAYEFEKFLAKNKDSEIHSYEEASIYKRNNKKQPNPN
ncbi:MAG: hypothetical protein IJX16_03910, partial [Clostridia bacterium]|nr:hypothetical protein [Clostridia bacterium]